MSWHRRTLQTMSWVDVVAASVFAAIQASALWYFGVRDWQGNDGIGYLELARQIKQGLIWTSVPDIATNPMPISLFRLPGYAILIVIAEWIAGAKWNTLLVAFQHCVAFFSSLLLFIALTEVSKSRALAFVLTLIYATAPRIGNEQWPLTDSLYTSIIVCLFSAGITRWIRKGELSSKDLLLGGLALPVLFILREITPVIAAAAGPLVIWLSLANTPLRQALRKTVIFYVPLAMAVGVVMTWNYVRVGRPIITTGAQSVSIFALTQIERSGTPVFVDDTLLSKTARAHIKNYEFSETAAIISDLFNSHGLNSIEITKLGTIAYFRAWKIHKLEMMSYFMSNFWEWRVIVFWDFTQQYFKGSFVSFALNSLFDIMISFSLFSLIMLFVRVHVSQNALIFTSALFAFGACIPYFALHVEHRYIDFTLSPILVCIASIFRLCLVAARDLMERARNVHAHSLSALAIGALVLPVLALPAVSLKILELVMGKYSIVKHYYDGNPIIFRFDDELCAKRDLGALMCGRNYIVYYDKYFNYITLVGPDKTKDGQMILTSAPSLSQPNWLNIWGLRHSFDERGILYFQGRRVGSVSR